MVGEGIANEPVLRTAIVLVLLPELLNQFEHFLRTLDLFKSQRRIVLH